MKYATYYLADVYGAGAYGANEYNATGTSTGTNTQNGNGLADTGFDILLGVTIGSAIIFSALLIRFWKRPAKKAADAPSAE